MISWIFKRPCKLGKTHPIYTEDEQEISIEYLVQARIGLDKI